VVASLETLLSVEAQTKSIPDKQVTPLTGSILRQSERNIPGLDLIGGIPVISDCSICRPSAGRWKTQSVHISRGASIAPVAVILIRTFAK